MSKKFGSILVIFFIFFSSLPISSAEDLDNKSFKICSENSILSFEEIKINNLNDYSTVEISNSNSKISVPGKPDLPLFIKTYYYPIGTKILDIRIQGLEIYEQKIIHKIKPAAKAIEKNSIIFENDNNVLDDIYLKNEFFPKNTFDYKISCGLDKDKQVVILNLFLYPIRYNAFQDKIIHTKKFDIKISYQKSSVSELSTDEYDMVIICPNSFKKKLETFVEHKNDYGIKTKIKTTNSIYLDSLKGNYDKIGRDKAEMVKYFIKWAKENWGVDYVLLVGGRVGQLLRWHVPVRYTNLMDSYWESGHLSDLYFADLYRYNKSTHEMEFEDWDSNNNGVFAEANMDLNETYDELDLYPDVNIGRLACRNKRELEIVIDKIIYYEKNTFGKEWFRNFLAVGGDTYPIVKGGQVGYYEGEIEVNLSASYVKDIGFNITRLFTSKNFTHYQNLTDAIDKGAGLMHISGHGNPSIWTTFPPDSEKEDDSTNYSFLNLDIKLLNNNHKLPVCVIGACHSSQFDVSILTILRGILKEGFFRYFFGDISYRTGSFKKSEWVSRCWSWNMVVSKNGGSIATIGNTGLGYGPSELNCTEKWDGYIASRFFYNYKNLSYININNLGDIYTKTLNDYLSNVYNVYYPYIDSSEYLVDLKTVQGWHLLGDPSLEIGGYPPIY